MANICVFCGASSGGKPVYEDAARETGHGLAARGMGLVFGGGGLGLMGIVARAARDGGAPVTGILPEFLRALEPPLSHGEVVEIAPDMQSRKNRMIALADAFVVLPGGIGTVDEFFEVLGTAQLGVHDKPIAVVNTDGFFDRLQALMAHIVAEGFSHGAIDHLYRFCDTPDEALDFIAARLALPGR